EPKEIDRTASVVQAAFQDSRPSILPGLCALPSAAASFICCCSLGRHYPPIGTWGTSRLSPCAIAWPLTLIGRLFGVRLADNQSNRTSAEGTVTMSEPLPALCLIAVPGRRRRT